MNPPPPSPAELKAKAEAAQVWDPKIPLKLYYKSASTVFQQARIYLEEGDFNTAYILFWRVVILINDLIPKHPQASLPDLQKQKGEARQILKETIDFLEKLKLKLTKRHQEYVEKQKQMETERQRLAALNSRSNESEQQRKNEEAELAKARALANSQDFSTPLLPAPSSASFSYEGEPFPALDELRGQLPRSNDLYPPSAPDYIGFDSAGPLPPKPDFYDSSKPPMIPPKPGYIQDYQPPSTTSTIAFEAPRIPPKPTFVNTGVDRLRDMVFPTDLVQSFLALAKPNTLKNLETCGILCGKLKQNVLIITTLLIPKQTSTSDTCSTINEEELFDYQDKNKLFTMGWIHTHPSQRCFMSSVDLHTHCSYQLMLPEAIAVVCAPQSKPSLGFFRLTNPPGLQIITNCREKSFHPHQNSDEELYLDGANDASLRFEESPLTIKDFRV